MLCQERVVLLEGNEVCSSPRCACGTLVTVVSYLAALGLRQAHPGPRQLSLCLLCHPGFLLKASDIIICLEALIEIEILEWKKNPEQRVLH